MDHTETARHDAAVTASPVRYGSYFVVWIALVMLTGLTVTVAGLHLAALSVLTAVAVASVKAFLVLNHFMHMKHESWFFRLMLGVAILTLAVTVLLTFTDIWYRARTFRQAQDTLLLPLRALRRSRTSRSLS